MEVPVGNKGLAQLEADLARINVMRLRGDIQTAKHLCAELLAQKPDFAQAQALMGDLCMDSGDFMKAADWFDMAAANSEESPILHERAELARRRVQEVEALAATKRLGIPTSRNKLNVWAGLFLGIVAAVCLLAFYLGGQFGKQEPAKTIKAPLELSPAPGTTQKPQDVPKPSFSLPASDERVLNLLKGSILGSRVLLAYRDPRGPSLVVTLEAPAGEFTVTALGLDAAQILRDDQESARVTIRYMRNGENLAMATMTRQNYDAAVASNKDLGTALEEVWPSLSSTPTSEQEQNSPPSPDPREPETETPAGP